MIRFKIFGIDFSASFPIIALMSCVFLFDKKGNLIVCFFATALHEIGHLSAMFFTKNPAKKINIKLFDIQIIDKNRTQRNLIDDLLITLSGVIFNFITFIIFICLYYYLHNDLYQKVAIINISICLFNMLPVSTLDGGQALFLILNTKFLPEKSSKIIDVFTVIILFPISLLGFILLFNSKYNFSLLLVSIYIVAALVMKKSKFI